MTFGKYLYFCNTNNGKKKKMSTTDKNAQNLKVGSIIEVEQYFTDGAKKVQVKINRVSKTFVWFSGSGFARVGRTTIDKFPTLYKIISI